ncbi:MAG: A/G-specific adenine glycosylase [Polyangiaceae bacterium]|nr:A/G-specific adenine glycosylase [Polyangiaceae bacterium]
MDAPALDEGPQASVLLAWFDAHKRDLPWRRTTDPYAIWLSEIMLQQTRVDTVVPYFERFLVRFPDVRTLAGAPLEDVLSAWSGLGYYRRARGLHAAAREIVSRYGGDVPRSFDELSTLPGVGAYTAGAVSSIAFGERSIAVDGNVTRVITRLRGIDVGRSPGAVLREVREACEALVPSSRPGDFNQALMELGATVCTPASPRCDVCPWRGGCAAAAAAARGEPRARPSKPNAARPARVKLIAALDWLEDGVLLGRRPLEGLFGGLWEPPMVEAPSAKARRRFRAAGIEIEGRPAKEAIVHVLTHRVLEVRSVRARSADLGALEPYEQLRRFQAVDLPGLPMSALARRLLRVSFGVP